MSADGLVCGEFPDAAIFATSTSAAFTSTVTRLRKVSFDEPRADRRSSQHVGFDYVRSDAEFTLRYCARIQQDVIVQRRSSAVRSLPFEAC